ncbi:MAG TPA: hypothetical protein VGF22_19715 [Acidimicrobiales bacterium]
MPKTSDRGELRLSSDELREVHLALALRIAQLTNVDTRKMGPAAKAKVKRHLELCEEVHGVVQKARGK